MLEAKKQLASARTERDKTFYESKCATLDRQIDNLVYELRTDTGRDRDCRGNVTLSYELTQHARDVIEEREIRLEWMERVLINPALTEPAESDLALENRFGRITEFGNRVLRVVVNTTVVPERVVSVYFDRRMKDRL
jgi:Domain of unknown function (DUF4258)